MKTFLAESRAAVMVTLLLAVVCCLVYPAIVYGLGQILFHDQAGGSLIVGRDGNIQGSRLIGQPFTLNKYFISRPSDAGANGMSYDPTSSGGSNLGPTSRKLYETVAQNLAAYRAQNGLDAKTPVPADAVTASASGLDPHISLANAEIQATRVARERGLNLETLRKLIRAHTDGASLGLLGEPGVNVLQLNLALDALQQK